MGEGVKPIYVDLASESDDPHVTQVPSLCMACHNMGTTRLLMTRIPHYKEVILTSFERGCLQNFFTPQGTTRLLMTRIPHYKEVILTSFECENCGNRNSGCQTGMVGDVGVKYRLDVRQTSDLTRQVVRSEHATVTVPELELEIPATSEKGEVTTVEGLLNQTKEGLNQDQSTRRCEQPDVARQIDDFLERLSSFINLHQPFTLIVDDPSGNSFVENPQAPKPDPQLTQNHYRRTPDQNEAVGLARDEANDENAENEEENKDKEENEAEKDNRIEEENEKNEKGEGGKDDENKENVKDEVLVFSTLCERCSRPTTTNMKVVQIPYFKEVIIMALHCDGCGHRTNEVKSGAGISEKGRRITLTLTDPSDLTRDVLKSDTCDLIMPELDLTVGGGLIGGKFTTLEGLFRDVKEDLVSNPFLAGDSAETHRKAVLNNICDKLDKVIAGQHFLTLILDDPSGNSYVQNVYAPDPDPNMTCDEYVRTADQDEALGLLDMKTENYLEEEQKQSIKIAC